MNYVISMPNQQKVAEFFEEQGCVLLDIYTHSQTKMKWVCPQGHENHTSWSNFRRGRRCPSCSGQKPYTIEQAMQLFAAHGCTLLEASYRNMQTPMSYICKCGREAKMRLDNLINQKNYCIQCRSDSRRGEKHFAWFADREEFARRKAFKKRAYQLLRRTRLKTNTDKASRTEEMLGYTHEQLREHIESHANWSIVKDLDWHLDHIYPIQAFFDRGVTDLKLINCLENLQPISQKENNEKKDKYDEAAFDAWLASKVAV